jgi:hypothetical protein
MDPYIRDLDAFLKLLSKSRVFNDVGLKVILYKLNYIDGKMVAHSKEGSPFYHKFDEDSLASLVLERRSPEEVADAQTELLRPNSRLSRKGVNHFKISGPVVAVPVRAQGYTASVLVAWGARNQARSWRYVAERLQRMANLSANDPWLWNRSSPLTTDKFLEEVNLGLRPIDHGSVWYKDLIKEHADSIIKVLLGALLTEAGLRRVRLWRKVALKPDQGPHQLFLCVLVGVRNSGGECEWSTEPLKASWSDDPFCQYTLKRYEHDALARTQHRKMFGDIPDPNCDLVGKAPDGYWTVAPIVGSVRGGGAARKTLMGYVSADNHFVDPDKQVPVEEIVTPQVRSFQRCALDIVTDLLRLVCASSVELPVDLWPSVRTKSGPLSENLPSGSFTSAIARAARVS